MIILKVAVVIVVLSLAKNYSLLLVSLVYDVNVGDSVGVSVGWVIGGFGSVDCIGSGGGSEGIVLEVAVVIGVLSLAMNANLWLDSLVYHINVGDSVGDCLEVGVFFCLGYWWLWWC